VQYNFRLMLIMYLLYRKNTTHIISIDYYSEDNTGSSGSQYGGGN